MGKLTKLADDLIACSGEELETLQAILDAHDDNAKMVGLTAAGDPVPPNPTHPPKP